MMVPTGRLPADEGMVFSMVTKRFLDGVDTMSLSKPVFLTVSGAPTLGFVNLYIPCCW